MISYDSLTTPPKSLKIDLNEPQTKQTIKTRNVPGYDASKYACERRTVKSRDGVTDIPISIVYNKAMRKEEGTPQHLHLYGYGSCKTLFLSHSLFSLLLSLCFFLSASFSPFFSLRLSLFLSSRVLLCSPLQTAPAWSATSPPPASRSWTGGSSTLSRT